MPFLFFNDNSYKLSKYDDVMFPNREVCEDLKLGMWIIKQEDLIKDLETILKERRVWLSKHDLTMKKIVFNSQQVWLVCLFDTKVRYDLDYILESKNSLYEIMRECIKLIEFDTYVDYRVGSTLVPVVMSNNKKYLKINGTDDNVELVMKACRGKNITQKAFDMFNHKNETLAKFTGE